jgi:hypothetical protein
VTTGVGPTSKGNSDEGNVKIHSYKYSISQETDMEKYGFVYIWHDRKHNRYYIGCHWGTVEDSYICSSTWMRNSYRRRPHDFKRRILEKNIPRETLFDREYVWLSMIRDEELGVRYYNLNNRCNEHWSTDNGKRRSVADKIGDIHRGKTVSEETREKIRVANLGKKLSEETKEKMRESYRKRNGK